MVGIKLTIYNTITI